MNYLYLRNIFFLVYLAVTFHLICYSLVENRFSFYHIFSVANDSLKRNLTITTRSTINASITKPYKNTTTKRNVKIFCVILTSKMTVKTKGRAVVNAWAKKCDNYRLVALITNETITNNNGKNNTTNVTYITRAPEIDDVLQPPGLTIDAYENLSDKVFLTFMYLYRKFLNKYDWFLKADDDTFIFVDHLREFLSNKNASKPVTYGYDFKVFVDGGFHSGGGGYLMPREALKRLGSALTNDYAFCGNSGLEDVDVGSCLRKLGVYPNSSLDELGRERFHPLSLFDFYHGRIPNWLMSYARNNIQQGLGCCSDKSISFHYMSPVIIDELSRILENFHKTKRSNYSFRDIIKALNYSDVPIAILTTRSQKTVSITKSTYSTEKMKKN